MYHDNVPVRTPNFSKESAKIPAIRPQRFLA